MKLIFYLFLLMLFSFYYYSAAQTTSKLDTQSQNISPNTITVTKKPPITTKMDQPFRTEDENFLTILFLIFAAVVLVLASILLYKFSADSNVAFKYFIIVLLVLSMLILIPASFNENQISPAVGLFGTIAGYLLGRTENPKNTIDNNNK